LNEFLRNTAKKLTQRQEWFPIAGWIWDGLHYLPSYRGITYRGIGNLDLEKVFGRV